MNIHLGSKLCYACSSVNQCFYTITISQEPLAKRTWNVLLLGCAMKASIWMHPMLRMSSSVWSSARPTTTATGSPTLHSWLFVSCYTTAQCWAFQNVLIAWADRLTARFRNLSAGFKANARGTWSTLKRLQPRRSALKSARRRKAASGSPTTTAPGLVSLVSCSMTAQSFRMTAMAVSVERSAVKQPAKVFCGEINQISAIKF